MYNRQRLAEHILQFHGGGSSYMYQLGSSWYGNHEVGPAVITGAIKEIDDYIQGNVNFPEAITKADIREIKALKEKIVRAIKFPYRTVVIRGDNSAIAIVEAKVLCPLLFDFSFLRAVSRAVTQWVKETEEGKVAYCDSSEDFNVGDLSLYLDDPDLINFLRKEGIYNLKIHTEDVREGNQYWTYDTLLFNRGQIR